MKTKTEKLKKIKEIAERKFTQDLRSQRYTIEEEESWREIVDLTPSISLEKDWTINPIPAFAGAMLRFRVNKGNASVSVYLDFFERLGIQCGPYWEVYPSADGDVERTALDPEDSSALVDIIKDSFEAQEKLKIQENDCGSPE